MKIKGIKKITYLQLLALHVLFAFVIYFFGFMAKVLSFAVVVFFLIRILSLRNRNHEVLVAAGYVTGIEVFNRMTGGTITYEFAKYSVIMFLTIGMFFRGFNRKSLPFITYILLLVPGILVSAVNLDYGSNLANAIGFNLSGPVALGISALYCYNTKISMERFQLILLACLLPIISMTAYLFLYTPDIRDVVTNTASNFAASGGFGPNQVATVLGLGGFILFTRLFVIKSRFINIIDVSLLAIVIFRAFATFSRGGIVTAAVCGGLFLFAFFSNVSAREKAILLPKMLVVGGVLLLTWLAVSVSTFGLIDKRYANQDAAGRSKEDLTTGRIDLFNQEIEAFYEHPITGIGVGKAKEYRIEKSGRLSASHNEVSRVLSEHGLFGFVAMLVLIFTPLFLWLRNRSNVYLLAFTAFWFLTINHSSMRIVAPAFIYGLGLLTVVSGKKKNFIRRQQLTE